ADTRPQATGIVPATQSTADLAPSNTGAIATPTTKTYVVQPGDTLTGIAAQFNVQLPTLLRLNPLANPNVLEVGQVIILPGEPTTTSPEFRIISDSLFVRGPDSKNFDVATFIAQQPGYIRNSSDTVEDVLLTGAEVVQRVSLEYSVDARLLLAILQYRSEW